MFLLNTKPPEIQFPTQRYFCRTNESPSPEINRVLFTLTNDNNYSQYFYNYTRTPISGIAQGSVPLIEQGHLEVEF